MPFTMKRAELGSFRRSSERSRLTCVNAECYLRGFFIWKGVVSIEEEKPWP
jgi:hypothetical protein